MHKAKKHGGGSGGEDNMILADFSRTSIEIRIAGRGMRQLVQF